MICSSLTYTVGRMLSCLCWKEGDGVTASRADWFTRAAISCNKEMEKNNWKHFSQNKFQDFSFIYMQLTSYKLNPLWESYIPQFSLTQL